MYNKINKDKDYSTENKIDGLILLPTRELAIQVYKEFQKFFTNDTLFKKNTIGLVIGGFSREK